MNPWQLVQGLWGTGVLGGLAFLIWKAAQLAGDVADIKENALPHIHSQIRDIQKVLMGAGK